MKIYNFSVNPSDIKESVMDKIIDKIIEKNYRMGKYDDLENDEFHPVKNVEDAKENIHLREEIAMDMKISVRIEI